jgi:hypothetical protein
MKRYEEQLPAPDYVIPVDNEYTRKDFERKYAGRL